MDEGLRFSDGDTIKIRVPFSGHPNPTITWHRDGKEVVEDNKRVMINETPRYSTLIVHDAAKDDEGNYTVTATNTLATDSATIPVTVVGKNG